MEGQRNNKVITLSDLWNVFVRRLWIIVLVAVLVIASAVTITQLTFEPQYDSVATLYILQQNQSKPDMDYDDFNLALKIVNDCTYLIKSHSVLDSVIKELELDVSYEELYDSVKITNPQETRILEVKVISDSPEKAKRIVDEICTAGTTKITEAMGFKQVSFYEKGILNENPCNHTSIAVYLLLGVFAGMLVYLIFLMVFIFDDKIRTDEDVKNYLNLSILGNIANYDLSKKKNYSRKYSGNKYYRNKYYQGSVYGREEKK